jgi:hypothetical protein
MKEEKRNPVTLSLDEAKQMYQIENLKALALSAMNMREYLIKNIKRLSEKVVKKHKELYIEINSYYEIEIKPKIETKNESKISFNEKVWYWYNNINNIVLCKECGENPTKFNDSWKNGYKDFCSVKCASSSKITKGKIVKTNNEKYGKPYYTQTSDYSEKCKSSSIEKYGKNHFLESETVRDKIVKTNNEKYGHDYGVQSDAIKSKMKKTKHKKSVIKYDLLNVDYDITNSTSGNNNDNDMMTVIHKKCGNVMNISRKMLYDRMKYNNVCDVCNNIKSFKETELLNFIKSLCIDIDIELIENDRSVLNGKELDVYIPSKNLAIEFNGLYWHSEKFKDKNYHINKSLESQEKGIQLLHIFEDDWNNKKEIVKSIIRNKLGKIDNKIYARKCIIKEVKSDKNRIFLDNNHIQGFSKSTYKLGLYYNNELVSLMTFGYRKTNTKKEFELIRFCNRLNTNVVGASSKLFKHFIKNYKIKESYILSYADISIFDGKMYDMLGFKEIHLTVPNYFWVVNGKKEHRWKYNKQNLIKEGFVSNMTEREIMYSRGYYRIYSCGQKRYEYKI